MGYGSQHDLTLNMEKWDSAKFNGRKLIITQKVESWDFTHPMDGMTGIKPDMLKVKFYSIELTTEDLASLKKQGVKRGDYLSYHWEKNPEGGVWSGYTRSKVKNSFPIDCKGRIEIDYIGEVEVTAKVTYRNLELMENFIEDVLDYFPDDESCMEYMESSEGRISSIEDARLELHEINHQDNLANYGVSKL